MASEAATLALLRRAFAGDESGSVGDAAASAAGGGGGDVSGSLSSRRRRSLRRPSREHESGSVSSRRKHASLRSRRPVDSHANSIFVRTEDSEGGGTDEAGTAGDDEWALASTRRRDAQPASRAHGTLRLESMNVLADADANSLTYSGPLEVREGALRKHWVQRLLVLKNGELLCFVAASSAEPLWFVTVDDGVQLVPPPKDNKAFAERCFSLQQKNGKLYHLRAHTAEEKLAWVSKINLLQYTRVHGGTDGLRLLAESGEQPVLSTRSISSAGGAAVIRVAGNVPVTVPGTPPKTSPPPQRMSSSGFVRPLKVPALGKLVWRDCRSSDTNCCALR